MDWSKLEKDFDKALNDEEYWNNHKIKKEIKEKRFDTIDNYLKDNDFEILLDRLLDEHSDSYIDKCYKKSHEPHPNQKLSLLLEYMESRLEPINTPEWIGNDFPTTTYYFKGYYFSNTFGQGVVTCIYDSNKDCALQI